MSSINFGVLNPTTTSVYGPEESHYAFLRGVKGDGNFHYPPEVIQRRDNTFEAALALTLWLPLSIDLGRMSGTFVDIVRGLMGDIRLVFLKMPRPGAPQGVEWDAPSGVLNPAEERERGMVREFSEEVLGLKVGRSQIFTPNNQYAAGVYREWYALGAVLATGEDPPKPSLEEGALGLVCIPLRGSLDWIANQNAMDVTLPNYCGVDGKVRHALLELCLAMKFFF